MKKLLLLLALFWIGVITLLTRATCYGQDSTLTVTKRIVKVQCDSVVWDSVWTKNEIFRGVYINALDQIAGNAAKENALIRDLKRFKFNHTYSYGVGSVSTSTLAKLNGRIRRETSCKDVGATAGSCSSFLGARTTYNKAVADTSDFSNWNLEFEAYNAADVAAAWNTNLVYLRQMQGGKSAAKVKDAIQYFGWWTKYPMNVQTPDTLIKYTDYLLLHEYTSTPSFSYLRSRCNDANAAGKRANKVVTLRVLFSAEPDFMGPWLRSGHTLDEAYNIVKSGFDAMKYTNLKLDGYVVFHIDHLRASMNIPVTGFARMAPVVYSDSTFKHETSKDHLRLAIPPIEELEKMIHGE